MLMLAHTPNDAKQIESQLRGAGHPLRVLVAPGLDSFIDILEKSDIVMAVHDLNFSGCSLIQVVEAVGRSKPGTPVLQLSPGLDTRGVAEAIGKGADGVITMSHWDHLELVCQREYANCLQRKELAALESKLAELEQVRSQDMAASSAPGLQVQEGIIVGANLVLAQALDFAEADDLVGIPLMDIVAAEHQAMVKDAVKLCLKGRANNASLAVTLVGEGSAQCALQGVIQAIEYDGEPAVEIRGLEDSSAASSSATTAAAPGRRSLAERLARDPAAGAQGVPALILLAIDDFETLEKQAGFAGAEELVEGLAQMLESEKHAHDALFRFSLHEWALVGRRPNSDGVSNFVKHFQRSVARQIFPAQGKELSCTISAVVYPLSDEAEDAQSVLRSVRDELNKLLEHGGGNAVKVTGSTAEELDRKRQSAAWLEDIRGALSEDRFDLAFQNIASLAGEERQYSDILLRMIDKKGEELVAAKFLPFAEEHGMMPQIDRWVIQRAISTLEKQLKERRDPCFFVRLSEDTLAQGDELLQWLQKTVDEHPDARERIVIVLRERHLQNHMKRAQALINSCKKMKIFIGLDHFGNTRHSHQLLARLKVDFVKLHADFTETIGKSGVDQQALEAIMEAARQHHVKTIAERVTDANGMARLWQMGVNYIMGSHVHEPDREMSKTRFQLK